MDFNADQGAGFPVNMRGSEPISNPVSSKQPRSLFCWLPLWFSFKTGDFGGFGAPVIGVNKNQDYFEEEHNFGFWRNRTQKSKKEPGKWNNSKKKK